MLRTLFLLGGYVRAFTVLYLCLFAGNTLSSLLPIAIPGSIIGMLILFMLLSVQIIPLSWVQPGCHLLIRYMTLFFIPISVGIIQYQELLSQQFIPIVVSCVGSSLLVMLVMSYCARWIDSLNQNITTKEDK